MKYIKRNIKFFIGIVLTAIICISGTAYAIMSAKEIDFVPTDSSWEVNNVEDALNSLFSNNSSVSFRNASKLYDSGDFSTGGNSLNINYMTKNYTLSESDVNTYNSFLLVATIAGAKGTGYDTLKSVNIPSNSLNLDCNTTNASSTGEGISVVRLIGKQEVSTTLSIELRGHCRVMVYGLK